MSAEEYCCQAGAVLAPEDCPWHPKTLAADETITVCSRCQGTGHAPLRGAERVREAMGWPRETDDRPCAGCGGRGVAIVSQAELDARLEARRKPKLPPEMALQSHYAATMFSTPPLQLPKDFS